MQSECSVTEQLSPFWGTVCENANQFYLYLYRQPYEKFDRYSYVDIRNIQCAFFYV